jgi:hypothetical protein
MRGCEQTLAAGPYTVAGMCKPRLWWRQNGLFAIKARHRKSMQNCSTGWQFDALQAIGHVAIL